MTLPKEAEKWLLKCGELEAEYYKLLGIKRYGMGTSEVREEETLIMALSKYAEMLKKKNREIKSSITRN